MPQMIFLHDHWKSAVSVPPIFLVKMPVKRFQQIRATTPEKHLHVISLSVTNHDRSDFLPASN
jgi:hypothetical protein